MHNSQKKKIYTFSLEIGSNLVYSIQAYRILGLFAPIILYLCRMHRLLPLICGGYSSMHFNCVFKHISRRVLSSPMCWFSGLMTGICSSLWICHRLSWVQDIVYCKPVSPVACIATAFIPFLSVVYFLRGKQLIGLNLTLFLFAFGYGFSGSFIGFCFGSGAWLVRLLILSSASCSSVIIWFLVFRHWQSIEPPPRSDYILPFAICFVICLVNLLFIFPVLSSLAEFFIL